MHEHTGGALAQQQPAAKTQRVRGNYGPPSDGDVVQVELYRPDVGEDGQVIVVTVACNADEIEPLVAVDEDRREVKLTKDELGEVVRLATRAWRGW